MVPRWQMMLNQVLEEELHGASLRAGTEQARTCPSLCRKVMTPEVKHRRGLTGTMWMGFPSLSAVRGCPPEQQGLLLCHAPA